MGPFDALTDLARSGSSAAVRRQQATHVPRTSSLYGCLRRGADHYNAGGDVGCNKQRASLEVAMQLLGLALSGIAWNGLVQIGPTTSRAVAAMMA